MVSLRGTRRAHQSLREGLGLPSEEEQDPAHPGREDEGGGVGAEGAEARLQEGRGAGQELLGVHGGPEREQAGEAQGGGVLRQPGPRGRTRHPGFEPHPLEGQERGPLLRPALPRRQLL